MHTTTNTFQPTAVAPRHLSCIGAQPHTTTSLVRLHKFPCKTNSAAEDHKKVGRIWNPHRGANCRMVFETMQNARTQYIFRMPLGEPVYARSYIYPIRPMPISGQSRGTRLTCRRFLVCRLACMKLRICHYCELESLVHALW